MRGQGRYGRVFIKRLADIDMNVLKAMIKKSIAFKKKTYPLR